MLTDLLAYVVLGLVLAGPGWRLLRWLGVASGLWAPQWKYLQSYVPVHQRPPAQGRPMPQTPPKASP